MEKAQKSLLKKFPIHKAEKKLSNKIKYQEIIIQNIAQVIGGNTDKYMIEF